MRFCGRSLAEGYRHAPDIIRSLARGRHADRRFEDVPAADREWLLGQLRTVRERYGHPTIAIDYVPATDRAGRLGAFLQPALSDAERQAAACEGWILGLA